MAHVVFLRAANVGGNNVFRPAQLAKALEHLGVVNVGAAGTFVVRERVPAAELRREFLARLKFDPAIAIVPAKLLMDLVRSDPFHGVTFSKGFRGWAAPLCGRAKSTPTLPIVVPSENDWSVRFERVHASFALGVWRWRAGGFVFASNLVEKALGVPATTRWWETFERIAKVLDQ